MYDVENITADAEENMNEESNAKENETRAEKFIRLGEFRMNKAMDAIARLENLSNRSSYEYSQEQVDAMFGALENQIADIKAKFVPKKAENKSAFSFGNM